MIRTSFGTAHPTFQATLPSRPSTALLTSSLPANRNTDFRDNLPTLAFSGVFRRKPMAPPTDLDVAKSVVLDHLVLSLSHDLHADRIYPFFKHWNYPGLAWEADELRNIGKNLATQMLIRQGIKETKLSKQAAQYACLLLLKVPRMKKMLEEGLRAGYYLKKDAFEFNRNAAAITRAVLDWLDTGDRPGKLLDYQEEARRLPELQTRYEELKAKAGLGLLEEGEPEALQEAERELPEAKERLQQKMRLIGKPDIIAGELGIDPEVAIELQTGLAGLIKTQELTESPPEGNP